MILKKENRWRQTASDDELFVTWLLKFTATHYIPHRFPLSNRSPYPAAIWQRNGAVVMRDETMKFEVPYKNELPWCMTRTPSKDHDLFCKICTQLVRNSWITAWKNRRPSIHRFWFLLLVSRNCMFLWVYLTVLRYVFTHDAVDDVIAPGLPYPFITIPICLLITLNLYMHYFYAVTISPGFLDDPPRDSGNNLLWVQKPNLDKEKKTMARGASWSENGVKITPASMGQCQKCNKLRPEVSLIWFYGPCQTNSKSRELTIVTDAINVCSSTIITVPWVEDPLIFLRSNLISPINLV